MKQSLDLNRQSRLAHTAFEFCWSSTPLSTVASRYGHSACPHLIKVGSSERVSGLPWLPRATTFSYAGPCFEFINQI